MKSNSYEEWQVISDFERYEISNFGRVRNREKGHFIQPWKTNRTPRPGRPKKHYLAVSLFRSGGKKCGYKQKLHRLLLTTFVREPKEGEIACHRNDNSFDNRLENLYWGTPKQNTHEMIKNGRGYFPGAGIGEKHPRVKLKDQEVINIRKEYIKKYGNIRKLAKKYNVKPGTISRIVNGYSMVGGGNEINEQTW